MAQHKRWSTQIISLGGLPVRLTVVKEPQSQSSVVPIPVPGNQDMDTQEVVPPGIQLPDTVKLTGWTMHLGFTLPLKPNRT